MNHAGLYQLAALKRQQAAWSRAKMQAVHTDPRIAHECEESAKKLEDEAAALDQHIRGNEELILNIETLIHYFHHSPAKSADRTLAMRDLENSSMRLQRELGSKPE